MNKNLVSLRFVLSVLMVFTLYEWLSSERRLKKLKNLIAEYEK